MSLNLFYSFSHLSNRATLPNRLTNLGLLCVIATASVLAGCDKTAPQNGSIDSVDNALLQTQSQLLHR